MAFYFYTMYNKRNWGENMKLTKVGTIVNTHGIKGELRIMSGGRYSNNEFSDCEKVVIDGKEYEVTSYRKHKAFHMITLKGYNNINQVLQFVNKAIFVNQDMQEDDEIDMDDLIGMEMTYKGKVIGVVDSIGQTPIYSLLVTKEKVMIPFIDNFVKEIDDQIILQNVEGFFDEK